MSKPKSASAPSSKPVRKLAPVVSIQKFSPTLSDAARACVKELEHLLSLARKDQLHGFAYISMERNAADRQFECSTYMVGDAYDAPIATLGALEMLKHDVLVQAEAVR